jgi:hypothetical protein
MNSKRIGKILQALLIGALVYSAGYLRTSIFVSINALSSSVYYNDVKPDIPGYLSFIADKSYPELLHLKETLTLAFVGVFCLIALGSLYLLFRKKIYLQVCLVFYTLITLTAFVIGGMGIIIPSFYTHGYNISRNLLHIAQSPFTVFFLLMVAFYHRATQS